MFLRIKNKRSQKLATENDAQDRIANSIVRRCIKAQEQCAAFLQQKSQRLSVNVKKFLLVSFLLLTSGYCLYLISESFFSQKNKSFSIAPIKIPAHTGKSANKSKQPVIVITTEDYLKIQVFRYYMDSLTHTLTGRRIHDIILATRPGLMDSIRFIENVYQLQTLKK